VIASLLEPKALFWLIPILIIFLTLYFKRFISFGIEQGRDRKKFKSLVLITRILIFVLLIIALAKPYGETRITTPGESKLVILLDNTSSIQVMETLFIEGLKKNLGKELPVNTHIISSGQESDLGDRLLNYLASDTSFLLISDGNVNAGASLGDVALLAANLNSSISVIELEPEKDEAGVYITGPDETVSGVNNTFMIHLVKLGEQQVSLKVTIDNEVVINEVAGKESYSLEKDFSEGEHIIKAEVSTTKDYFEQNNEFYKTVSVVKKPRILLVTDSYAPVEQILNELYDVTRMSYIPSDLDKYYAVIIYDQDARVGGVERLADYLVDKEGGYYGNGLFVIGGFDSFDRGDYKNSLLETYLPVYVGKAATKRGSSNIVLSIDFSGSSGTRYEYTTDPDTGKRTLVKRESDVQDIEKALAVSVINSLGPDNSVGATIFSTKSATVSEIQPLFLIKEDLMDKISRIQQPAGQSYFHIGLSGAYNLLKGHIGDNNIIMVTDGNTGSESIRQQTLDTAKTINARGVKVYVVGTGRNVDEEFLQSVAYNGGGIYFPASQENRLRILFGEPEESKFGELFDLFLLNPYHYITQGLELDASLYGFNQVIPKSSAQLLVTTQNGEPAVTVWNYGLGRVATLNVFSGNNNLGDLLNKRNSVLLTRIINWCIGDPERKEDYYVNVADTRIGSEVDVVVKSRKYPSSPDFSFVKTGENQYQASFTAEEMGVQSVLGKSYAVNYEKEYQYLGMNSALEEITSMSGGKIFKPSQTDEIISFVKTSSKKSKVEKTTIIWPFLLAAIIIFLIEICIRKAREKKLKKS